ncbi:uncharacterized protein [Nicotiana tomentosiformis]|uniref:uncharacterized protein n=1 Tax=Nicotiana tomentosiformis TaxID=4098 RepID=UPI00388C4369
MKSEEVEIPSIQIIVEAEIEDKDWVKNRLEQLTLIDEKRLVAVCHGQLYQQRIASAYNKKVRLRKFEVGQLVLRCILPHHEEAKGNWLQIDAVKKVLYLTLHTALMLNDWDDKGFYYRYPNTINSFCHPFEPVTFL